MADMNSTTNEPPRSKTSYFETRMAEIKRENEIAVMSLVDRKHVMFERSRHGRDVYYYRKGNGRRIRLPDPTQTSPEIFNQAYAAAQRGAVLTQPVPTSGLDYDLSKIGRPGYVYFIRASDKVKIGFTSNLTGRLRTIRATCPDGAEIIKVIPGAQQTERYFHAHFRSYRLSGEWFLIEGALAAFLAVPVTAPCNA